MFYRPVDLFSSRTIAVGACPGATDEDSTGATHRALGAAGERTLESFIGEFSGGPHSRSLGLFSCDRHLQPYHEHPIVLGGLN